MDNLVLTRLTVGLARDLPGAVLEEFRQEAGDRFRLVFALPSGSVPLTVSLRAELPWIGQAPVRWDGPAWSPDPFAVSAARALVGRRVERVLKELCDRSLVIDLGGGGGLAVELLTHGANLALLKPGGEIQSTLRHPKRSAERLTPGRPWAPRALPTGKLDPFAASSAEIDGLLTSRAREGEPPFEVLRREVFGVGSVGAELVLGEARARGLSPGSVLEERLRALRAGDGEVLIEGPGEPLDSADRGEFSTDRFRLLPWRPHGAPDEAPMFCRDSTSRTVGLFHESLERAERLQGRIDALRSILRAELRRTRDAEERVGEELRSFVDPQRYARLGEALLAGLSVARRSGGSVFVPDPYDPSGREIAVPTQPGKPLAEIAGDLFKRSRRARRGATAATARAASLAGRANRLASVLAEHEYAAGRDAASALEAAMRAEGLAVGLSRSTRAATTAALAAPPQVDGVRIVTSADGWTILVGRTGRDNDRLTFKIAAPDDVWLHAAGVPGAHVIVRNPLRTGPIPPATLAEAARLAAWFSDSRAEAAVEVQWTRRKNVRRAKGGAPGRVVLKRFDTVRVRPAPPAGGD